MFGKRKTKEKKMRIYVKFLDEFEASKFQYRLLEKFTICKIKQVINAANYTYEFTIIQDNYFDFLKKVFIEHCRYYFKPSAVITKIKI